jgi:hypothetical protein
MFVDIKQNTDEWLELRMKKATSSNFAKIMANEGKSLGDPAIKYARKIALEIVTGERDERGNYKSSFMEDGHDLEPIAIQEYEIQTFSEVTNGGFYHDGNYGDSPDGNVGEDGCVEAKSVIANTQWVRLEKGGFDTSYKWQIHGHIWLGKKKWCDFVSYCPEMPENKQLYVYRVERDEEMIKRLKARLNEFWELVEKKVKLLKD